MVGGNERAAPGSRFDDHRPVAQSRDEAVALHETRLIGRAVEGYSLIRVPPSDTIRRAVSVWACG